MGAAFDIMMPYRERAAIIMALLKAKGINCFHDYTFVEDAKAKSQLPILDTTASTQSSASAAGRNASMAARPRNASMAGNPATPRARSATAVRNPQQEKLKNAADHFQKTLRTIQSVLANAVRSQGYRVKEFVIPAIDPLEHDGKYLDWGIPVAYMDSVKGRERREIFGHMKTLIVLWDVVTSEGTCMVEDVSWAEFLSNSHLFLKMTNEEFARIQSERLLGAGQEYEKVASGAFRQQSDASAAPSAGKAPSAKKSAPRPTSAAPGPRPAGTTPKATPTRKGTPVKAEASPSTAPSPTPRPKTSTPVKTGPRPYMGIKLAAVQHPLTAAEKARGMRTAKTTVTISECAEYSPAFDAGLRVGDTLHRFGGFVVTDIPSFNAVAARSVKIGANIPIQYIPSDSADVVDGFILVREKDAGQ
jgi:hypothetical protein